MNHTTYLSKQVDDIVARCAADTGALLLRDVLLDLKTRTADCRYLWMDRFGVLAIDLQEWPGTRLKGSQAAREWTAVVKQGGRTKFENPVKAAEARHSVLVDALLVAGRRFEPEYIQELIVFMGADTSGLQLDDVARSRCVDLADVDAHLRSRSDFAPNLGILESHEVADLESLFRVLDRSDDDGVAARHAEGSPRRGRNPFVRRAPDEVETRVSNSVAGVAPVAIRLSDRYPSITTHRRRSMTPALLVVLFLLVAVWLFGLNGRDAVAAWGSALVAQIRGGMTGTQPAPVAAPAQSGAVPDVARAVEVLRENAPEVAATAVNLESPTVSVNGDTTAYTWVYKKAEGSPAPGTMTLTFDSSGALRGASGD